MAPFKKSTTQLPAALREELGLAEPKQASSHPYSQPSRPSRGGRGGWNARGGFNHLDKNSKSSSVVGRKEARKAARIERKTKPTLKVIGRGLSAEQHQRQKKDGGTAKSFQRAGHGGERHRDGKQNEMDLDAYADMIHSETTQTTKLIGGKKRKKKDQQLPDPSSRNSHSNSNSNFDSSTSNPKKRSRDSIEDSSSRSFQRKHVSSSAQTPLERMLAKAETKSSSKGKSKAVNIRKKPRSKMTQAEKDEEDEIRWLEAKLAKEKKGDELEDDLDVFLQDLDRFQPGMFSDEDEEEEGGGDQDSENDSGLEDELATDEEDSESGDEETDWEAAMQESDAGMEEDDSSEEEEEEEGDDDFEEREDSPESSPKRQDSKPVSPASTSGKYIPPAARAAAAAATSSKSASGAESAEVQRLRRQAKGQLNRLGENNIESILFALTDLYGSNRRAEVTATLTSLILETISARADLGNRFVVLYAALVGGLHRVIGVEFGAAVVQKVVENLLEEYQKVRDAQAKTILDPSSGETSQEAKDSSAPNGKECVNLLILLSELYNLQIVACPLIYDFVRLFLRGGEDGEREDSSKGMVDIDIELLLKIVKTCGQQLRHDDPTSLKSIISLTQESVAKTPSEHLGSRPKFMLETLNDLKNNRTRKSKHLGDSNGNSSEELTMKLKKWLNGLSKKHSVRNFESLRVGLKDLREAKTKGKWWLVGAAWTGHQDDEIDGSDRGKGLKSSGTTIARPLVEEIEPTDEITAQLLKEARKHGMNTDSKRKIFVAIMSAEDYLDAGTKLLQLKLNEVQRRDIIRVLLHCLGQENVYNPYYTLIGTQLSKDSQEVKITLQYSLWDLLREMGERKVGGLSKISVNEDEDSDDDEEDEDEEKAIKGAELQKIVNIARAYGWWVAKGCLSLNALKTVDFTNLKSKGRLFLQLFFIHLLLSIQSTSPSSVLTCSSSSCSSSSASSSKGPSRSELAALESVLMRGMTGNQELAKGVQFFLLTELKGEKVKKLLGNGNGNGNGNGKSGMDVETRNKLDWSLEKSRQIAGLISQGIERGDGEE